MSCIQLQSPLFVLHPKLIHRQRLRRPKLLWLSSNEPAYNKLQQFQHYSRGGNINAISNPILLGITHPSKSGDIYGLLQLGSLLPSLFTLLFSICTLSVLLCLFLPTHIVVENILAKTQSATQLAKIAVNFKFIIFNKHIVTLSFE